MGQTVYLTDRKYGKIFLNNRCMILYTVKNTLGKLLNHLIKFG